MNSSTSRPAGRRKARRVPSTENPADARHLVLMLALTFSTGVIDAVGYLGLDRVFTGNMTGNVVILGMALTGADDLPIVGPVVALVGFLVGAALGGRVLRPARPGWTHRTTTLFSMVTVTLAVVAVVLFVTDSTGEPLPQLLALSITGALGGAMGLQAATARFIAVKDVTTVVVTSTLTGLAADSVFGSRKPGGSGRRFLAVALITLGAFTGAALLRLQPGLGVALAALISAVVTVVGALSWQKDAVAT